MNLTADDIKKIANKPKHIAIIMDGNGRWAKSRNLPRLMGHSEGVKTVKEIVTASGEAGIKYLTVYAFSKENWKRPKDEVNGLMTLLYKTAQKEIEELHRNNVQLRIIGDKSDLPEQARKVLEDGEELTRNNDFLTFVVALSYGGRDEIMRAVRSIAEDVKQGKVEPETIDSKLLESRLDTSDIPDPDLVIRTSGEFRTSNYLLWQSAYAEYYIAEDYWPDFHKDKYYEAIRDYTQRERRYGKTSEQVTK